MRPGLKGVEGLEVRSMQGSGVTGCNTRAAQ